VNISYNHKTALVIIHDLLMVVVAWQLSWWIRFNFEFPFYNWELSLSLILVLLLVQGSLFLYFHLYRGLWRFASLRDLWNIFRATIVGAIAVSLVFFIMFRLEGVPRSVLLLYPVLLIFLLGGPRLGYRLWKDRNASILTTIEKKRVLVIGAGNAGDMLVRDMHRSESDIPVAILDDNESLKGAEIRGVKICGAIAKVKTIVEQYNVDWIAIAIPSASRIEIQAIVEVCEQTKLPIKILPNLREMQSNHEIISGLREVSIEDLLGREQVDLDWKNIQGLVADKCVLVTGGGGSIGSVLCHQIAELSPSNLIIVDHSEYNLYKIEQELSSKKNSVNAVCFIGDVCDERHMSSIFLKYKPQLVFHAAAYKHVPILEAQPHQGIKNNILGTKTILDLACKENADKFILISTDKAVNPANVLGLSKRIAELYTESVNQCALTKCITVRFGNVLDSAGSVVPLFREQIKNGGPVTVTHAEITRFFMTIKEAAQLILQAGAMGQGGEIFVLDMGDPVKIKYLAEQMIQLSGKQLHADIEIVYSGLRPGEKLYEELFYTAEQQKPTMHEKIFLAKHSGVYAGECARRINEFIIDSTNYETVNLKKHLHDFMVAIEDTSEETGEFKNIIHIDR